MLEWFRAHDRLLWWLAVCSVVTFVGTLLLVPWAVARIPADYFTRAHPRAGPWSDRHPMIRAVLVAGKNVLGFVFLLAGIAMLVLPGQGLLTIMAGVMLLDFPGKHRLERWIVSRPAVLRSINWMRQRAGHAALVVDAR